MIGLGHPASVAGARPEQGGGRDARPLRVGIVIARLEGGAGALALRGARVLNAADYSVTIVTGSGQRLREDAGSAGLEVILEPSLRAPISPRRDLTALRRLTGLFTERSFDVVHTHCAKGGAVGRLAARRAGIPRVVHTYHGFPFHEFQSAARRHAYVRIEQHLGRYTDLALCVGAGVAAEAARRRLIAPDRIATIGVAIDDRERAAASKAAGTAQARRRARAALGLPLDVPVVGVVGRLDYQKAPEDFLAAMQALGRPDAVGVWIGDGDLAPRIRRRVRTLSGTRVILAGERDDVLDVLPAFDVFALPSRYEGLPTAIVEAMICGVPVVATAVNAVPDVVIPGETGLLVPPRSPDLLAEAIGRLLDSPAVADRLATTARTRISGRYDESALREALTAAYLPSAARIGG